jgi:glycerol dehydrogenase-like iron-containing ADH family enzyme
MDIQTRAQFHLRTKVRFGVGTFAEAGAEAAALGKTALVVTGRSAMRRAGLTDRLVASLSAAGVRAVLYEEATPNPTTGEVDKGADLARREGVDVVVGLGGGSAMDVAKAIAMAVAYDRPCYEICGVALDRPGLPVVAITTTSGTGAEVTGVAVVTEPSRRHKTAVRSLVVAPTVAIVDPELTVTMPPAVTASTGMDALAHAVESYFSKNANPFTEPYAEEATDLVLTHLQAACGKGGDLEARTGMATASTATANSGSYSALIGSKTTYGFNSTLVQAIDVPASGATTLNFYAYFRCPGADGLQEIYIVDDTFSQVLDTVFEDCFGVSSGSWRPMTVDLTPYAGTTVVFYLRTEPNIFYEDALWFYVDDITVTNQ